VSELSRFQSESLNGRFWEWPQCLNLFIWGHDCSNDGFSLGWIFLSDVPDCPHGQTATQRLRRYKKDLPICHAQNMSRLTREFHALSFRRIQTDPLPIYTLARSGGV
jgi:hypothetical protein